MKVILICLALFAYCSLRANCKNAHCNFEYNGYVLGQEFLRKDFIGRSTVTKTCEKYFHREFVAFRELDWILYNLERSVAHKDEGGISNAVNNVAMLLQSYTDTFSDKHTGTMRRLPFRLRMDMLEKIEYSLVRIVLGKGRPLIKDHIELLIPEWILNESESLHSWHSITTFKNMICLAFLIEDYYHAEGCYPLNLDGLTVPVKFRKCACGRDIEYEYHANRWVLRNRCESYDGGLGFDEYIPMIYNQRKHLDLCLSPSFNVKRRILFSGAILSEDDERISGRVVHDPMISGVHNVIYSNPSAGCGRIVPLSEQEKKFMPMGTSMR